MIEQGSVGTPPRSRPRSSPPLRLALLLLVLVALSVGGALAYWWKPPAPPVASESIPEEDDGLELPVVKNPGYLGASACAPCHAKRVATFEKTSHFRACRPPRPGEMPEAFAPGKGTFVTADPHLRFEMTQQGDDFVQTAIRTTSQGDQRTATRIAFVYGANKADEVYHGWHDDGLYELPMSWLHPLDSWGISPLYRSSRQPDFSRETTVRCIECHNTWVEHVPGTRSQYRREGWVLGTNCESCHGPGREHVDFHQANPKADSAHAIILPSQLSRDRLLEVCTQCHSNSPKPRGPAFRYRPGEELEKYVRTNQNTHPEMDHVANQIKYLRQSKCFQKSEMTCINCHDPHEPHTGGHDTEARKSCLQCHEPQACRDRPHLPASVRDDCAGCHMPARVWMNVHFHTEKDEYVPAVRRYEHRIAVYPEARKEVLRGWLAKQSDEKSQKEARRLGEELIEHWLARSDALRKEHRPLAAIGAAREALAIRPTEAARQRVRDLVALRGKIDGTIAESGRLMNDRRLPEAKEALERVLKLDPTQAMAYGKLGTLFALLGKKKESIENLKQVARYDPDMQYGFAMLGWTAYLDGRAEEAVEAYRQADAIEPYTAKIQYQWGLALLKLGRWDEAFGRLRTAVEIDPKEAGAWQAASDALRRAGKSALAVRYALRAVKTTNGQNADVLVTLAEAYAAADRRADAIRTAERALSVAEARSPEQVTHIRIRLEELRR